MMRKFMSHMRTLDKFEWLVLSIGCMSIGVCVGFAFGGAIDQFLTSEENIEIAYEKAPTECELARVSSGKFTEGNLASIFTAERGTMIGKNKYRFTKAKLVEIYAGTPQVKAVISADTAEIEMMDGEMISASWYGNFKRRQFGRERQDAK